MCPLVLITKPVPLLSKVFPGFDWDGQDGAAVAATTGFGATEKSPAFATPRDLILTTQFASIGSRGPVEVRLNWNVAPLAIATIRLDFRNCWAAFGGSTAVTRIDEVAVPNSRTCD